MLLGKQTGRVTQEHNPVGLILHWKVKLGHNFYSDTALRWHIVGRNTETLVSIWISLCPELTALLTVGMPCSWTVTVPCPGRHLVIMNLPFTWVSSHCMSEVWIVLGDGKDRIVSPCLLDLTHHNGLHCTRLSSSAEYTERDLLRRCFGYSRSLCGVGGLPGVSPACSYCSDAYSQQGELTAWLVVIVFGCVVLCRRSPRMAVVMPRTSALVTML